MRKLSAKSPVVAVEFIMKSKQTMRWSRKAISLWLEGHQVNETAAAGREEGV